MHLRWLALASFALLTACPDPTPVSRSCDRLGDPCQLENGTLGICSESLAATCAAPPCIACTPQH